MSEINTAGICELIAVMRHLRSPNGCPWDRKQTHQSLVKYVQEECSELMDSLAEGDDEGMCEELGDVLMHVVLHSVMAEERNAFDFNKVAEDSAAKMLRRHPHVFGEDSVNCAEEVVGLWEQVKSQEKADVVKESVLDGIPIHLPALLQADKVQLIAAKYGFDWSEQNQIVDKIEEELHELRAALESGDEDHVDEEIGDLLFAVSNLSRFRKRMSTEELLRKSIAKFKSRFLYIERQLKAHGISLDDATIEQMEALWQEAKSS